MKSSIQSESISLALAPSTITLEAVQTHTRALAAAAVSAPEVWKQSLAVARSQTASGSEVAEAVARLELAETMADRALSPGTRAAAFERALKALDGATRQRLKVLAGNIVEAAAAAGEARANMNQLATQLAADEDALAGIQKALHVIDNPAESNETVVARKALEKKAARYQKFWDEHGQQSKTDLDEALKQKVASGHLKCEATEEGFWARRRAIDDQIQALEDSFEPVSYSDEQREQFMRDRMRAQSLPRKIADSRSQAEAAADLVEKRGAELEAAVSVCDSEVEQLLYRFELEAKSLALMAGQVTTAAGALTC